MDFALPLCLQWPLAQLFPVAWEGSTGQCSVYISYMSMNQPSNEPFYLLSKEEENLRQSKRGHTQSSLTLCHLANSQKVEPHLADT